MPITAFRTGGLFLSARAGLSNASLKILRSSFRGTRLGSSKAAIGTVQGLVFLRNRYYDAQVGRFSQLDPIRSGTNWWNYPTDPIHKWDPMGLESKHIGRSVTFENRNYRYNMGSGAIQVWRPEHPRYRPHWMGIRGKADGTPGPRMQAIRRAAMVRPNQAASHIAAAIHEPEIAYAQPTHVAQPVRKIPSRALLRYNAMRAQTTSSPPRTHSSVSSTHVNSGQMPRMARGGFRSHRRPLYRDIGRGPGEPTLSPGTRAGIQRIAAARSYAGANPTRPPFIPDS